MTSWVFNRPAHELAPDATITHSFFCGMIKRIAVPRAINTNHHRLAPPAKPIRKSAPPPPLTDTFRRLRFSEGPVSPRAPSPVDGKESKRSTATRQYLCEKDFHDIRELHGAYYRLISVKGGWSYTTDEPSQREKLAGLGFKFDETPHGYAYYRFRMTEKTRLANIIWGQGDEIAVNADQDRVDEEARERAGDQGLSPFLTALAHKPPRRPA
ncbi:MAG: hypothetical protein MRY21_05580 [Simkaniaceae bacterium]|nr:hypothetical protein [Simkaniaceae bacterium]